MRMCVCVCVCVCVFESMSSISICVIISVLMTNYDNVNLRTEPTIEVSHQLFIHDPKKMTMLLKSERFCSDSVKKKKLNITGFT